MSGTSANGHEHGVRVICRDEIGQGGAGDLAARLVADLSHAPSGFSTLAARALELAPGTSQQADHHETLENVICVISGQATIRWGENLEFCCTAGPGDLVLVPAGVPHQAANTSSTEVLEYLLLTV